MNWVDSFTENAFIFMLSMIVKNFNESTYHFCSKSRHPWIIDLDLEKRSSTFILYFLIFPPFFDREHDKVVVVVLGAELYSKFPQNWKIMLNLEKNMQNGILFNLEWICIDLFFAFCKNKLTFAHIKFFAIGKNKSILRMSYFLT